MIFKDQTIENELRESGVVLLPKISDAHLQRLWALYNRQVDTNKITASFYWSLNDRDKELNTELKAAMMDCLQPFFEGIRPIVASFFVKSEKAQPMAAHQDWTFVNQEPVHNSYTCWIPLVDTSPENGWMGFIPGSHHTYTGYRASPSPQYPRIFPETEQVFSQIRYYEQKSGVPVLFNHRVVHGSVANSTNSPRPALMMAFASVNSELVHVYLSPKTNTLLKYAVDEHFFDSHFNEELRELHEQGLDITQYPVIESIPYSK